MTDLPLRALIFMTGRNCQAYLRAALESLVWQTHSAIHVLFVDDGSDDGTGEMASSFLAEHFHDRHTLVRNPQPWGKARSAHVHLRAALGQGDFVAVLDADDQLIVATILADLATQYAAGFDVVWTNYETDEGKAGSNGPLDPFRAPRGQGWKTSHFFSFRGELLHGVPEEYFQDERGDWLQAACDFAIAFPMLDQTRRYRYLPVRAYRYTATNPASHHNQDPHARGLNSRRQMRCAETVLAKPALPCTRWLFGQHAAADQAVADLQQRLLANTQSLLRQQAEIAPARPAPVPAANAWTLAAAATLQARCPALLDLALDGRTEPPDARLLWQWWQWLQRGPARPRVLEIGAGAMAAPLHAAVHALGGRITTVCTERERALALYARLYAVGIDADVLHVPLANAGFEQVEGGFADVEAVPEDAGPFDLVLVCADGLAEAGSDARLALPMVASRLNPSGFRLCLWSPGDARPLAAATALWRSVAPDLEFSERAFDGAALVVQPATVAPVVA